MGEAARKRMAGAANPSQALFAKLGVDTSNPGFYDSDTFLKEERSNPRLLEEYAAFVDLRVRSPEETMRVRDVVQRTAAFLFQRLSEDGRKGACVDASIALSRMLERRGVWNYIVKGALTLTFAPDTGLGDLHLAPIMMNGNPAVAGHAWICAPPFRVVDITAAFQPYPPSYERLITSPIIEESLSPVTPTVEDLFDPDLVAEFLRRERRLPTLRDTTANDPDLMSKTRRFGAGSVTLGKVTFRYIACGIGAPDEPLERLSTLNLSGKYPRDLYEELLQSERNT